MCDNGVKQHIIASYVYEYNEDPISSTLSAEL
jgi:hypothetical protein